MVTSITDIHQPAALTGPQGNSIAWAHADRPAQLLSAIEDTISEKPEDRENLHQVIAEAMQRFNLSNDMRCHVEVDKQTGAIHIQLTRGISGQVLSELLVRGADRNGQAAGLIIDSRI